MRFVVRLLKKKKKNNNRGILIAPDTYCPRRLRSILTLYRTSEKKVQNFFALLQKIPLVATHAFFTFFRAKSINPTRIYFFINEDTKSFFKKYQTK